MPQLRVCDRISRRRPCRGLSNARRGSSRSADDGNVRNAGSVTGGPLSSFGDVLCRFGGESQAFCGRDKRRRQSVRQTIDIISQRCYCAIFILSQERVSNEFSFGGPYGSYCMRLFLFLVQSDKLLHSHGRPGFSRIEVWWACYLNATPVRMTDRGQEVTRVCSLNVAQLFGSPDVSDDTCWTVS